MPRDVDANKALILVGDNWNDYSYRTLYTLYYKSHRNIREVGGVKILKAGQREGSLPLPVGPTDALQLSDEFVSLGANLDYYVRLMELKLLGKVRGWLNDLTSHPELRAAFAKEPALEISLYRGHTPPEAFFDEIERTIDAGGAPPGEDEFTLSFTPSGASDPLVFQFGPSIATTPARPTRPSRRISVIIGPNGVGKTQLLASLARVAYTPPAEREELTEDGVIPGGQAFPNIVAVSYSSFDNFAPPALRGDDRDELARDLTEGRGRYVYLGLRDPAGLLDPVSTQQRLLSQDELAAAFARNIERIRSLDRFSVFATVLEPVLQEQSFQRYAGVPTLDDEDEFIGADSREGQLSEFLGADPKAKFIQLSSGHKVVLHLLAGLTALMHRRGLVLIDEPETHLHPPLLAALMSSIRRLLTRQRAYCLVATHSPVVAQESLSDQVVILAGREPTMGLKPSIQTFGENVGALTREVFGFHPTAGDYRNILDQMVRALGTVEAIEEELGSPLSSQALAHVVAAIARRKADAD
jgi:ABC-type cobalamin/Fe3+-siderophores transport system ATPase subunit